VKGQNDKSGECWITPDLGLYTTAFRCLP